MEKFNFGKPPQKFEELTLETPEQAEQRIRKEDAAYANNLIQQYSEKNIPASSEPSVIADFSEFPDDLKAFAQELTLEYAGSMDRLQSTAEVENIARDLAIQEGIDIDFSKLMNVAHGRYDNGPEEGYFVSDHVLTYFFPDNSDAVLACESDGRSGKMVMNFKTMKALPDFDAQKVRNLYKPEKLIPLLRRAGDIYKNKILDTPSHSSDVEKDDNELNFRVEERTGPIVDSKFTVQQGVHQKINGPMGRSEVRISAGSKLTVEGPMVDCKVIIEPNGKFEPKAGQLRVEVVRL